MDDDDFNLDDLSPEENEELEKEMREERNRLNNHPLFKHANEILNIVNTLMATCDDEDLVRTYGSTLLESATVVVVKMSSLITSDNYLMSMQNAALIREHAQYLRLANHMLNAHNSFDKKYVTMFRQEMEEFRLTFKEFAVKIRELEKDGEDEWGVF